MCKENRTKFSKFSNGPGATIWPNVSQLDELRFVCFFFFFVSVTWPNCPHGGLFDLVVNAHGCGFNVR